MSNAIPIESMESAWLERRQAERVEAKLKVSFRELSHEEGDQAVHEMEENNVLLLAHQAGAEDPSDVAEAQTRDISVSGVRLAGEDTKLLAGRLLKTGVFLQLEITDPSTRLVVRSVAMVAWSQVSASGQFEAGLSIFAIDESDLQKLQRVVEQNKR